MTNRDNIIRLAREAGFEIHERKQQARVGMDALVGIDSTDKLQRFAELVKADFLQSTGQYLTNDASREAVIADAVAEEREACAKTRPPQPVGLSPILQAAYELGVRETQCAISARGAA